MRGLAILGLALSVVASAGAAAGEPVAQGRSPVVRSYALPSGAGPLRLAPSDGGAVWFCSRALGALGRLDAATGEVELVSLGQGARPVNLARGPNGKLFAVDGAADVIHEVDPETREHTRHAVSSELSGRLELSSAAFDAQGRLWFTGYAGVYGRLDVDTGQASVWPVPGGRGPVALTAAPNGALWFASYAQSQILRIDPGTGALESIALPTDQEGPKAVAADRDGRIWATAHRSGSLLRYDPGTRAWAAWRLPGGDPRPYALAVDAAGLWITDTGEAAVVSFSPRTETFAAVAPTTPRGAARDIVLSGADILVAESGADQILKLADMAGAETGAPGAKPSRGLARR